MLDQLNYFSISALINAITSLGLGLFIILTNYKDRVARYLVYFCFAVAAWSLPYFLWQISTTESAALFWSRALMFGAIFTSIAYFHMVLVFLKLEEVFVHRVMFAVFYFLVFFFVVANLTPHFVVGVEPKMGFAFWPIPGMLYFPFLLGFFAHVTYASILLYRRYRRARGIMKKQIFLLLVGVGVAFIGGSTNYFLWYDIPVLPWGNALVGVYVILTVYSIMKYGFLNFKVVASEIFAGILLIVSFIDVLFARTSTDFILSLGILVAVSVFGYMLVRSVVGEVHRREELARLAKSLEKANRSLKELDRQKTEFLSIASHQLRTPLSIIKGYIELIKDGAYGRAPKKMQKILDEMDASNERLVKLIDNFLNISRIEQGRTKYSFTDQSMNALIESVDKEIAERAHAKGITLEWKENASLPEVYMDDEKIRHVVFNFVDNAIKYSEEGSITISAKKEKDGVAVRVQDEGIGFTKTDEDNFFNKFYRGKNVEGTNVNGTGLGIYVCRQFVEAHGGHVWAHSKGLGQGSEFGFWIPTHRTPIHDKKEKEGKTVKQQIVNQYEQRSFKKRISASQKKG